jgi:hypothetical protein
MYNTKTKGHPKGVLLSCNEPRLRYFASLPDRIIRKCFKDKLSKRKRTRTRIGLLTSTFVLFAPVPLQKETIMFRIVKVFH